VVPGQPRENVGIVRSSGYRSSHRPPSRPEPGQEKKARRSGSPFPARRRPTRAFARPPRLPGQERHGRRPTGQRLALAGWPGPNSFSASSRSTY
jgi:hypothetical protein